MLPHEEALFGGALGGGKSDVLLMAALQYMDVPGFAGIIFRRSLSDLKLPGALLDRIQKWLAPFIARKEVKYVPSEHTYYFPTTWPDGTPGDPAKLVFGYIGEASVKERYQSAEFQYCAFDELTTWDSSEDYAFMFTRLRQAVCPVHKTDDTGTPIWNPRCPRCQMLRTVPKRMRSATNPGGSGGTWVKHWFSIKPDPEKYPTRKDALLALQRGDIVRFVGTDPGKAFIPSFLEDNPYLDRKSYDVMLERLSDADRDRLRSGNWEFRPDSRFKRAWIKYFTMNGDQYILPHKVVHRNELRRIFITVDPAASLRAGPIDTQVRSGAPSWSVISTWGYTKDYELLFLDMVRFQKETPEVVEAIENAFYKWKPSYVKIEYKGVGIGVAQYVELQGVPVSRAPKAIDKLENSTSAMMMMKHGRIYFPENAPWLEIAEDEIFGWTGLPGTEDDIIDTLSDAANDLISSGETQALPRKIQSNSGPIYRKLGYSSNFIPSPYGFHVVNTTANFLRARRSH
jgi:predicted phage terminase large subunit-like protein